MADIFWYLLKSVQQTLLYSVYSIHVHTGQVTLYKVPKNSWPCLIGHPVLKDSGHYKTFCQSIEKQKYRELGEPRTKIESGAYVG